MDNGTDEFLATGSRKPRAAFAPAIIGHLTAEDDAAFWETAIDTIFADVDFLRERRGTPKVVLAQVGACSQPRCRPCVCGATRNLAWAKAGRRDWIEATR